MEGFLDFDQGTSDITGFYQNQREYAVVGLVEDAAAIVDIDDPANPVIASTISGSASIWRDLKYWNEHLYIGTEAYDGIKVVDVSNPYHPELVYTITNVTNSHNIHIDSDGFLYIVGAQGHDIWIFDLSNPAQPQHVGSWDGEYLHDIDVYNGKIYGAGIYTGHFYIIDVSDKTKPETLVKHYTGSDGISTHDCAVFKNEKILVTADENLGGHIKIWDIEDYENINLLSEYQTHESHSAHNIYIRYDQDTDRPLLIVSYYVDGTRVLDVSDPVNPIEVGYFDTSSLTGLYDGNWGTYVYLPSGYLISSDRQNGLFIFSSPFTDSSLDWSDCSGHIGDNTFCYGDIYTAEENILKQFIEVNPALHEFEYENFAHFAGGRLNELKIAGFNLDFVIVPNVMADLANFKILDLSSNNLTDLPSNLTVLADLEQLNLRDNNIAALSNDICNLPIDCEVFLGENDLCGEEISPYLNCISDPGYQYCSECSSGIWSSGFCLDGVDLEVLDSLFVLNPHLNNIDKYILLAENGTPAWVDGKLTYLDFSYALIGQLPNNIGKWDNLKELVLKGNNLSQLPQGIGDMVSLESLKLHNNVLSEVPTSIGNLPMLEELYLPGNNLKTIPNEIVQLQNLRKLFLNENFLTELPSTICELPPSCNIQVADNCLTDSPYYDCIEDLGDQQNCLSFINTDFSPQKIKILPPYPNPFNPRVTLQLTLPTSQWIKTSIFNIQGERIQPEIRQFAHKGNMTINWQPQDQPAGMYFIQINGNQVSESHKVIYLK